MARNNGETWAFVQSANGDNAFVGNVDWETEVRNAFAQPMKARYVRLIVVEYDTWAMLRWAIEGCPLA